MKRKSAATRAGACRHRSWKRATLLFLAIIPGGGASPSFLAAQSPSPWHAATEKELQALLPARATVEKEHIETEMRTASGITDGHGRFVAGIVLITAGYAADGKYSHFLVTQVSLQIGDVALKPGEYVLGWERQPDSLNVHFYDAATGAPQGSTEAKRIEGVVQVASIRIWPPKTKQRIQIGRFEMPYALGR